MNQYLRTINFFVLFCFLFCFCFSIKNFAGPVLQQCYDRLEAKVAQKALLSSLFVKVNIACCVQAHRAF